MIVSWQGKIKKKKKVRLAANAFTNIINILSPNPNTFNPISVKKKKKKKLCKKTSQSEYWKDQNSAVCNSCPSWTLMYFVYQLCAVITCIFLAYDIFK